VHPQVAGFRAFFQVAFAGLFFLALLASVAAKWWWQLAMLVGTFSMLYLAAGNLNLWRYGHRMLEAEALEAHDHHIALARQAFIEAPRPSDPRLPTPSLTNKVKARAAKSWANRRRDYIWLAIAVAVTGIGVGVARYGFLHGWLSLREGLQYTSYTITGAGIALLLGTRTGWRRLSWVAPTWVRVVCYFGLHVLVIIAAIKFGPSWFEDRLWSAIRDNDPPMNFKERALFLAFVGSVSITYGAFFLVMRAARLIKSRRLAPKEATATSQNP
jgi:hypothetical protein